MMKNCECGAVAELFDLTTDTGTIQHQVICSSSCGRETAIWGGHSSLNDAIMAWNSDNVTTLYTVSYSDEKVSGRFTNTFSSFDLKVAARFACFLLQNNVGLNSISKITPNGNATTLWGYENEEDHVRINHSYKWLANTAEIDLKLCSCGEVIQQNSTKCATSICNG
ncbi:hypothetical protein HFM15_001525 [Vibrio cholerae]|nr:hypothetical protein [Vibrio cholerae]